MESERHIHQSSPAISADGTIYIGANIGETSGGEFIAVNPDGTERWRSNIIADEWIDSSPSIAEDGTVYIGSSSLVASNGFGFLHAFEVGEPNNPPDKPIIKGPTSGKAGVEYDYTFSVIDPDDHNVYYYIEWGDMQKEERIDPPYSSGEEVTLSHMWSEQGTYKIRAKAKDYFDAESD
jgi:outer membrane protein assembly factor BamB